MGDYIRELRSKIGQDLFIHPAARIIIENERNEIVFIKRTDNGKIGLPAGAFEFNETIEECIKREALEETGLIIDEVTLIGISTHPKKEHVLYPNGDQVQYFTAEFYTNKWKGTLQPVDVTEIKSVSFKSPDTMRMLPENEQSTFVSLAYYNRTGKVRLS